MQDAGTDKVVYLPLSANVFDERKVRLGTESGDSIEVVSGMHAGDRLVTKGSFDLRAESLRQSE